MKKITALLLICFLLFAVGCSNPNNEGGETDDPNNEQTQPEGNEGNEGEEGNSQNEPEATKVEGRIVTLTRNGDGLSSFTVMTDSDEEYLMNVRTDFNTDLTLGDRVSVTVEGSVSETAPLQATASAVDTVEEFAGVRQQTDVYTVSGISSPVLNDSLDSSRQMFKSFSSYDECQQYLEENGLTEQYDETVGDMDLTTLTDSFFSANDLYIFVTDQGATENEAETPAANEVYLEDGILFLKITDSPADATLTNSVYRLYLVPMTKDTEVSDGVVLRETSLEANNDENAPESDEGAEEITPSGDEQNGQGETQTGGEEPSTGEG